MLLKLNRHEVCVYETLCCKLVSSDICVQFLIDDLM